MRKMRLLWEKYITENLIKDENCVISKKDL